MTNNKEVKEKELSKLDWVSKEVSKQPTDRGIHHLKSQIINYIIPQAEKELEEEMEN